MITMNWRFSSRIAVAIAVTGCNGKAPEPPPCTGGAAGNVSSGGSKTGGAAGSLGDPGLATQLTGTKTCATGNDCTGGSPSTGFDCTMFDGTCSLGAGGVGHCKLKYASTTFRCMAGARVQCTTPNATEGVYVCNPSTGGQPCDWPTDGCKQCGANGEPCCIRGCNSGLKCKPPSGGTGGTSTDNTCQ